MTTGESNTSFPRIDAPSFFVERLMGLAIGPAVSKLVFGIENPPGKLTPAVQLTIPTTAINDLISTYQSNLNSPDTQKKLKEVLEKNTKLLIND